MKILKKEATHKAKKPAAPAGRTAKKSIKK